MSSIIAFSGHMTDAPDRPQPRFPEAHVPDVRMRMRTALEQLVRPLIGVSSAARGADCIFIRTLIALGGTANIILPFPLADFKRTSLGQGWDAELDELLRSERVLLEPPLYDTCPTESEARDRAFAECNDRILQRTAALASEHAVPDPLFLAVYKTTGTDLPGGTADAFERWKKTGGRVQIIEP